MAWNPFLGAQTARGYARARPDYHPQAVTVAARLLELDRPVETAADLGCGTGMSTRALRAIAAHVIGFDVSHPMLLAAEALPGVSYARAAAEQLPLQSQNCTASYSISWPTSCHPAVLSLRSSLDRSGAVGAARPPDPDVSRQSHSQDRDRPAVVQITTSTAATPSTSTRNSAAAAAARSANCPNNGNPEIPSILRRPLPGVDRHRGGGGQDGRTGTRPHDPRLGEGSTDPGCAATASACRRCSEPSQGIGYLHLGSMLTFAAGAWARRCPLGWWFGGGASRPSTRLPVGHHYGTQA